MMFHSSKNIFTSYEMETENIKKAFISYFLFKNPKNNVKIDKFVCSFHFITILE